MVADVLGLDALSFGRIFRTVFRRVLRYSPCIVMWLWRRAGPGAARPYKEKPLCEPVQF